MALATPPGGAEVVEVAEALEPAPAEIAFYNAAYLCAARKLGMKLVTEDSKRCPGVAGWASLPQSSSGRGVSDGLSRCAPNLASG